MHFHFVASTGRTATTFIARALDQIDGVVACHEGYRAADKDSPPLLPLINLENRRAYDCADAARKIVAQKRNPDLLENAVRAAKGNVLVDVAYYNSTIAEALLEMDGRTRMVGIIRQLEPFVRSATATAGEDPLPVGWASPDKPLTPREKFIAMGRIRPPAGSKEADAWPGWSAVMRNIWLWSETNALLLNAKARHPDRVLLLKFEAFERDAKGFLERIAEHFGLRASSLEASVAAACNHRNRKPAGYEIGPLSHWSEQERHFAGLAQRRIGGDQWLQ